MKIAVLNAGSGTIKTALIERRDGELRTLAQETIERREGEDLEASFARALEGIPLSDLDATAHRVVHGGDRFTRAVRIDAAVEQSLDELTAIAPLHNPPALAGIRLCRRLHPGLPAVAVFDTAFHAHRSRASRVYPLPEALTRELSLYRYGFHGLAHASLAESLARTSGSDPEAIDAVTLQLGSGCSACAIERGRSIETSMGFTPLEGLPMATRSGDVDPGVVLHLLRQGRSVDEVERILNHDSGLRGVGGASDVRELLAREAKGDDRAALALELFVRRIVALVGAYLTLLEGRGAIVFGGGIGTNSAEIRRRICEGLTAWDVTLDARRNTEGAPGRISGTGGREVHVFETEEEPLIARQAASVLDSEPAA